MTRHGIEAGIILLTTLMTSCTGTQTHATDVAPPLPTAGMLTQEALEAFRQAQIACGAPETITNPFNPKDLFEAQWRIWKPLPGGFRTYTHDEYGYRFMYELSPDGLPIFTATDTETGLPIDYDALPLPGGGYMLAYALESGGENYGPIYFMFPHPFQGTICVDTQRIDIPIPLPEFEENGL